MLARYFIERPVLSVVISCVVVLAGLAAVFTLPIDQYPQITPPTVEVSCSYPGASATVVQDTVAVPIEQEINGVENMLYMSSQCTSDGGYRLTITFELGTDLDLAQVLVQNRVSLALPRLPEEVKTTGVSTRKKSPSILLCVNLVSEVDSATGRPIFDQLYLSNYATLQIRDNLARIKGVGDISIFGQRDYSMRCWLDPAQMASRSLTTTDVIRALREQNVQVAAGRIGQPPVPAGQPFQYTLSTQGRLREPDEFGGIVVKTGTTGQLTRLRDIARIELGARNLDTQCTLDGQPSVGLALYQLPGSNALQTASAIRGRMDELARNFPAGLRHEIVYDTTPFITESVAEVFKTLRDAIVLVAIVVLFFLQDWRAMILPMIDVPVSLIGTFAVMWLLGFTLNNLTLFGLVLAIGIVVDDAIVVLENIERWLARGLDPKSATIKAMQEITGTIVAITLVLSSVFLPSAFLGGISGQFYRQFALTISASMLISALNALTMTPSRAVGIFQQSHGPDGQQRREALPWWGLGALLAWGVDRLLESRLELAERSPTAPWLIRLACLGAGLLLGYWLAPRVNAWLARLFAGFNRLFDWCTVAFGRMTARLLRLSALVLLLYGGLLGLTWLGLLRTPIGFVPEQDKGYLVIDVQLPDSASLERTIAAVEHVDRLVRETPGVAHTIGVPGQSVVLGAVGSNFGSMFVILDDFEERTDATRRAGALALTLRRKLFAEVLEAQVGVFGAPAIDGLGNAGGFKLLVEDIGSIGLASLQGAGDELAAAGRERPELAVLFNSFRATTPQVYIDVDRVKCKSLGVALSDVFNTLQVHLGGFYVNDFNEFGRAWQVNLQADGRFRTSIDILNRLQVRSASGAMVPLATVATARDTTGPVLIGRYNTHPAAALNGVAAPGVSSGQVIAAVEQLAAERLPRGTAFEWTELTYLQILEGSAAVFALLGAVVLVYFLLAAQFESWLMPAAILLVVPMCLLSAIAGLLLAHSEINIFVQVGLIVLVGLAAKNAIFIVQFAREEQAHKPSLEATVAAVEARLRPIVMTSFAFILGVVPLMLGHGAGAEMRYTLGVAVFSGMLGVTLFGLVLTPVFYHVLNWVTGQLGPLPAPVAETPHTPSSPGHTPPPPPATH